MRIAFYAPMKPPSSPVPSGDRQMARALIAALQSKGHQVELAARLVSREPAGSITRQGRLAELGQRLAARYIRRNTKPDLWFTYHLYYKAPDWIGPRVADALGIPYVVAEASFAPKRAGGPWDLGHRAVEAAIRRTDMVLGINPANEPCVRPLAKRFVPMKPFLAGPVATRERAGLLTVAMMRQGDKLASYRLLAEAMRKVDASLTVIGSGPAEREVRTTFAGLPVQFEREVVYGGEVFVWPAINEAYGMALLEAQSAGMPVVAGYSPGVAEIVKNGKTGFLVPQNDAKAFAEAVHKLLADPALRIRMGDAARAHVAAEHSFEAAADLLDRTLPR
jgi:glycosyltransferase involved in cell wall biosynthesis